MSANPTIIFGAPHGATFWGHNGLEVYLQAGKRSPVVPPGILEGDYVRDLLLDIEENAPPSIDDYYLFLSPTETPPAARAKAVNKMIKAIGGDCLYIEPHVNASGMGQNWNNAEGHIVFHNEAGEEYAAQLSEQIDRHKIMDTTNRGIRRGWFTVLKEVNCPALLAEMFFMTNKAETLAAATLEGQLGFCNGFTSFMGLQVAA